MRTKMICLAIALLAVLWGQPASAQLACTATVAVEPCGLTYTAPLQPGVPLGVEVRGYCGIPSDATAVFLHIKAGGSGATPGKFYFWPEGGSFPAFSQCNYQDAFSPNPVSCHVLVRLGGGTWDSINFWVQSTQAVNYSAIVEGYIAPATP